MSLLILFFLNGYVFSQEAVEEHESEPKNVLAFSFGYTHIPEGAELEAEEANGFFVPSIGLDYGRVVGKRWEIGVMLDWELDHYLIAEKELEREKAFIVVAGAAYNPVGHLYIFGGIGVELEKNEHLFVTRLGAEYAFHLSHRWSLAPAFYFDWKEDYDTYALSLAVRYGF